VVAKAGLTVVVSFVDIVNKVKVFTFTYTEGTACFLHFTQFFTTYRGRVFSIPSMV
jgi:hypothetical protein